MRSARLRYVALRDQDVDALSGVVTDPHVRRYLFDGEVMDRAWCEDAIRTSERTMSDSGLGLWLAYAHDTEELVGFCGFWHFDGLGDDLQLLYALPERFTGRGYATEMAEALVAEGRRVGLSDIVSAVDQPNRASIRVLERVGFEQTGAVPGAFGEVFTFVLRAT